MTWNMVNAPGPDRPASGADSNPGLVSSAASIIPAWRKKARRQNAIGWGNIAREKGDRGIPKGSQLVLACLGLIVFKRLRECFACLRDCKTP